MKVELLDFTGAGHPDESWHAADILIFTKNTRLQLSSGGLRDVARLSREEKMRRLKEMAATIPSSWEFADVTFLIEGVTRACAQQITRTRTGSYAMQSLRVVDARSIGVKNPYSELSEPYKTFEDCAAVIRGDYERLMDLGSPAQDARGILPLNTESNLIAKYNFRAFVDLVRARSSMRTQDEYRQIIEEMKGAVIAVWPWSEIFFADRHEIVNELLQEAAEEIGLTVGKGAAWKIAKAMDLLRKEA